MRYKITYLMMLSLLILSCSVEPEYDWSWVDDLTRPFPDEYDWFYDKWGLAATNTVSLSDYAFDGSSSLETTIDTTTVEDGERMLKYLDEKILAHRQ